MISLQRTLKLSILFSSAFCISVGAQTSQAPGTWQNVTPSGLDVAATYNGIMTVMVDPVRQSDCWFNCDSRGTWKSTDYGMTWKKVSTGINGDKQNTGRQWYAQSDMNPNRDPATSPTLYVEQGYGAGCVWKSTNGGVDWTNIWNNNIYSADGLTNISCDVGGDCASFFLTGEGPNHLVLSLHSYHNGYAGCGSVNNNGIFETTDGGGTWRVHNDMTFNFSPHSDCLFPIDDKIWAVSSAGTAYRTTNNGTSWNTGSGGVNQSGGRTYLKVGSTTYIGCPNQGFYKTTDKGVTWKPIKGVPDWSVGTTGWTSWIAATATKIYICIGSEGAPLIRTCSINNDSVWTKLTGGPSHTDYDANVTFDGTNYIILSGGGVSGVWRYVEPVSGTGIAAPIAVMHPASKKAGFVPITSGRGLRTLMISAGERIYDVKGRMHCR
jgi:hypothetical protein